MTKFGDFLLSNRYYARREGVTQNPKALPRLSQVSARMFWIFSKILKKWKIIIQKWKKKCTISHSSCTRTRLIQIILKNEDVISF